MNTFLTVTGLDGRVMQVHATNGVCRFVIVDKDNPNDGCRCERAATSYEVDPGGDREAVVACRCAEHGGAAAALEEIRSDWHVLAPLTVRDVLGAGSMALSSPERIVRIMREADEVIADRWHVHISEHSFRSLSSAGYDWPPGPTMTFPSLEEAEAAARRIKEMHGPSVEEIRHQPAGVRGRPRPWIVQLGLGSYAIHVAACATREEAIERGVEAWRKNLARRVEEIRTARGGTLEWGIPLDPLKEPVVIESMPGESSWDTYHRYLHELGMPD